MLSFDWRVAEKLSLHACMRAEHFVLTFYRYIALRLAS